MNTYKCLLVLDANVLIKDFWWKSKVFEYLQDRLFLLHTLTIPQISLEEATANLIRRAIDLKSRMKEKPDSDRLLDQYQRLYNKKFQDEESPFELGERYREWLILKAEQFKGYIAEKPELDVDDIIRRSINRTKPFNKGDKGFRDTILWFSVLNLVKEYQRISFVSENISDFADNSKLSLHEDLQEEVDKYLNNGIEFYYFRNLNAFVAQMDKNREYGAIAFSQALMLGGYKNLKLEEWLFNNLVDRFSESIIDSFDGVKWAGMPYEAEAPQLKYVEDIVGIEVYREKFIDDSIVEFYIDIALIGSFSCQILFSDWEGIVHHSQVEEVNSDGFWTHLLVRTIGTFIVRLTFDIRSEKILSFHGVPLESDYEKAFDYIDYLLEDDFD